MQHLKRRNYTKAEFICYIFLNKDKFTLPSICYRILLKNKSLADWNVLFGKIYITKLSEN